VTTITFYGLIVLFAHNIPHGSSIVPEHSQQACTYHGTHTSVPRTGASGLCRNPTVLGQLLGRHLCQFLGQLLGSWLVSLGAASLSAVGLLLCGCMREISQGYEAGKEASNRK